MVKKQRNNQAIFGPFLDLEEFLKNRGLSFETSDFGFRDLLHDLWIFRALKNVHKSGVHKSEDGLDLLANF